MEQGGVLASWWRAGAGIHFSSGLPDGSPSARRGPAPCMMLGSRMCTTRSQTYSFTCLWRDLFCICSLKIFLNASIPVLKP